MIKFISDGHIYEVQRADGSVFVPPSVTQIIQASTYNTDPWYALRGTAIHKGCELIVRGELDWSTVEPDIQPYLEAFESFRQHPPISGIGDIKSGPFQKWHALQLGAYWELWCNGLDEYGKPLKETGDGCEVIGYHPTYNYCGTIDLLTIRSHIPPLYVLLLNDQGKYKIEPIKQPIHLARNFITLASAYHIRKEYQI